jgi:hypothetical protein
VLGAQCFCDCHSLTQFTFETGSRLSQIGEGAFFACDSLSSIVIPKMVRILKTYCFNFCSSLCSVVFESESNLETIESRAFSECTALDYLCLPASLKILSEGSLDRMSFLKSLPFESGSKLREIEGSAFWGCESLKSISLPASLSVVVASAFIRSYIEEIFVDGGNPHYFVSGPFLIGVDGMTLIRYFGRSADLGLDCLRDLGLRQIGRNAFSHCSTLKSVCIPASIDILGECCFSESSLAEIMFDSGSGLSQIGIELFLKCFSLTSICIPANVESISNGSFCDCRSLVKVSFETGSKLTRIEDKAFVGCCSLASFVIPAQLEIMTGCIFYGCTSLCELIFEVPSRLKQLDLPPSEFGSLFIPDCVEVVFGGIGKLGGQRRLLQFGRESCLMKLELRHKLDFFGRDTEAKSDSFVRLSKGVLRRFRCQFEG